MGQVTNGKIKNKNKTMVGKTAKQTLFFILKIFITKISFINSLHFGEEDLDLVPVRFAEEEIIYQ